MLKNLPNDPMLCLSVVNTKLRDYYPDLDALCLDLQIKKEALTSLHPNAKMEYFSISPL